MDVLGAFVLAYNLPGLFLGRNSPTIEQAIEEGWYATDAESQHHAIACSPEYSVPSLGSRVVREPYRIALEYQKLNVTDQT
jgi:hypothetical protein